MGAGAFNQPQEIDMYEKEQIRGASLGLGAAAQMSQAPQREKDIPTTLRRLEQVTSALEEATEMLEQRTAPARNAPPAPNNPTSAKDGPGSAIAAEFHTRIDRLHSILGRIRTISETLEF